MTMLLRFALPLAVGVFFTADGYAQSRGSGGMSGGCRSAGGRPAATPPTNTSPSSPYNRYPTPSYPSAGYSINPSLYSAFAQSAYLASLQATRLQMYQARSSVPQTAQLQAAPVPYTSAPSPAAEKSAAEPKKPWAPPTEEPEYVPHELATIRPDPVVVLATDPAAYDRYMKAIARGDDPVVRDLDTSGQVLFLYEPTEVAVLSRSGGFAFVRPTGGPQKDKTFVTRARLAK